MPNPSSANRRLRATAWHFAFSLALAGAAALLVFQLWYPGPYAALSGGLFIFLLLVGIDVVLGPLLTAVIASPAKPRAELVRDISIIVVLQLAAFGYGLHAVAEGRPVVLAFEVDRMRLVSAAEIDPEALAAAPPAWRELSWTGPRLLAARKPTDPDEQRTSIELALAGIDLAMVPRNWTDYAAARDSVLRAARPVSVLTARYPQAAADIAAVAQQAGVPPQSLVFLPLQSRRTTGVTLIAPTDARVLGHLPLDGFF
jgi:hypothetical protein